MDGIQRNRKMSQLCLVHKSILAMNIEFLSQEKDLFPSNSPIITTFLPFMNLVNRFS